MGLGGVASFFNHATVCYMIIHKIFVISDPADPTWTRQQKGFGDVRWSVILPCSWPTHWPGQAPLSPPSAYLPQQKGALISFGKYYLCVRKKCITHYCFARQITSVPRTLWKPNLLAYMIHCIQVTLTKSHVLPIKSITCSSQGILAKGISKVIEHYMDRSFMQNPYVCL